MQIELAYNVPYARLAKLGRSASFKTFRASWLLFLLMLATLVGVVVGLCLYIDVWDGWLQSVGVPFPYGGLLAFGSLMVLWVAGCLLLGRFSRRQVKSRSNFDAMVRLTTDDGGIRIATDAIEYYLKWQGITQMLMERDGVVVSHGILFFLIPDTAFADAGQRLAFVRDVYGRLTENARSISERYVRPLLDVDGLPS